VLGKSIARFVKSGLLKIGWTVKFVFHVPADKTGKKEVNCCLEQNERRGKYGPKK